MMYLLERSGRSLWEGRRIGKENRIELIDAVEDLKLVQTGRRTRFIDTCIL